MAGALAAIAPFIGPALGIAGAAAPLLGGGGGGQSGPKAFNLNPGGNALGDLFGQAFNPKIGFQDDFSQPGGFLGKAGELKRSISDFAFNPLGLTQPEQDSIGFVNQNFLPLANQALGEFQRSLPGARELGDTGFLTELDNEGVFGDEFNRRIAQAREQFGGQLQGSDFGGVFGRELGESLNKRDFFQAGLQEQASNRRAAGLAVAPTLAATAASFPTAAGQNAFNFGTGVRGVLEEMRSRPLSVFSTLSGLNQPGQIGITQQGFNPVDPIAGSLGALAEAVPAFLNAGSGLFGGGGGGGGTGGGLGGIPGAG